MSGDVSAIVLAAGASSRMGQNKMLLPFGNSTVIRCTVNALALIPLKEIIVVTGRDADLVSDALEGMAVRILKNNEFELGMTSSIQRGVAEAQGLGYMICLGDMPLISTSAYISLIENFTFALSVAQAPIIVPVYLNTKGNPVIFHQQYRSAILAHAEPEGCRNILLENPSEVVKVDMKEPHVLMDIDSPADYARMLKNIS